MEEIKAKYNYLKSQLTESCGQEESPSELMWNELILEKMDTLFDGVPKYMVQLIKLNHL